MGAGVKSAIGLTAVFLASSALAQVVSQMPGVQVSVETTAVSPVRELKDAPDAPTLVVVPAGGFLMGSPLGEAGHESPEEPQHRVEISRAFAMGKNDVTFDEWDACVAQGGCNGYSPRDEGWGRGSQPVINVSYDDVMSYIAWLRARTGKAYRLPTEAEWEYAARGGTTTRFWWGDYPSHEYANFGLNACCGGLEAGADRWQVASPVGSFQPNPFGLFDMSGNVMQYVADCWHANYRGAPADGSVWTEQGCGTRTIRGGSWSSPPEFIRSADRIWVPSRSRLNIVGFRVARDVE